MAICTRLRFWKALYFKRPFALYANLISIKSCAKIRNAGINENPDLLYEFVEQGVLSQITVPSITGHFGKKIQKLSFQIIENDLTHFVASDAHNVTSRPFKIREAFEIITNQYDFSIAQMFRKNGQSVIADRTFYPNCPSKIKKKKFGLF